MVSSDTTPFPTLSSPDDCSHGIFRACGDGDRPRLPLRGRRPRLSWEGDRRLPREGAGDAERLFLWREREPPVRVLDRDREDGEALDGDDDDAVGLATAAAASVSFARCACTISCRATTRPAERGNGRRLRGDSRGLGTGRNLETVAAARAAAAGECGLDSDEAGAPERFESTSVAPVAGLRVYA